MSFTDYYEAKILNEAVGCDNTSSPFGANVWVGLSSTTPTDASASTWNVTEPSGDAYTRQSTSSGTWTTATVGSITTATDITWTEASGNWVSSANLTYATIWDSLDSSGSNNLLAYGALTVAKPVLTGDTAKILAGNLTITLA
tara:strand:+ start:171 stop:599 length:429 start_codon:yes stop_codon:yes gene_type:complete